MAHYLAHYLGNHVGLYLGWGALLGLDVLLGLGDYLGWSVFSGRFFYVSKVSVLLFGCFTLSDFCVILTR